MTMSNFYFVTLPNGELREVCQIATLYRDVVDVTKCGSDLSKDCTSEDKKTPPCLYKTANVY